VPQWASLKVGASFCRVRIGGEAAGGGGRPTVVRFEGSRLEGTGYLGGEEGGPPFNGENGIGVKRRCLV
jgi:hypothetical protein